ncbi:MAG: L-seryl-tRNA(Sec) selenium transferase [Comamonas sp.]|jgi:L-seryl-tRNA(Ser) seleniumtransferase|uniref:L-seryl-tRNA(Sec) selenium transferase n=1 Tax=Comamonas sp. TaxID=34028 RepID=UPI00281CC055|nr:L-seryl-tRNA(Sec) selenium transferase [Comamonas sp.]MDR0215420.1 L-seryl-tRNA(Sec) selenium transferase [Comamonas sp.]
MQTTADSSPAQQPLIHHPSQLPAVDKLLLSDTMQQLRQHYGLDACTQAVREVIGELRTRVLAGEALQLDHAQMLAMTQQRLEKRFAPRLRPVFNLTGTVLHTNLGRALLPQAAIDAVVQAMSAPANLEYDLEDGGRGDRDDLVESLICELTGAEAATIVNNNAAAVLLVLSTLALNKEVIVSRGELVEIGGAFRIPDVMTRAGARLVEVGTTNRTHDKDYAGAIGDNTAALMKVHCSNYAITGFTKSVSDADVAHIAREHQLPTFVDLGSGTLVDLRDWGLPHEVTVRETVESGADIVTFSGDKLLGGPQAGIIVGRKALIAQIKKNPLKRALRVGKITMAALEPTLRLYLNPEKLAQELTTLRLFTRKAAEMQAQAELLQAPLQATLGSAFVVETAPMTSQIGSGALPVESLPSYGLKIHPASGKQAGRQLTELESRLRALPRPVIGRLHDDALWLDLRCLEASAQAEWLQQLPALTRQHKA